MFKKSEAIEFSSTRPFLPKTKPIKNLVDFVERVNYLRAHIEGERRLILSYEGNIQTLANGTWKIEKNEGECYWCVTPDQGDEAMDNAVRELLNSYWSKRIEIAKEMIHSCEDELDWLEMKMRVKPSAVGHTDYNFNIDKDHA